MAGILYKYSRYIDIIEQKLIYHGLIVEYLLYTLG